MTKFIHWLVPASLVAAALSLQSCNDPESIGLGILPQGDQPGLFFTDTITLEASTHREDSLRSDEGVAVFNLAGSYTDPVFGRTSASFYSQIRLPNNNTNFSFGPHPSLDSVVLTLAYSDYYGDTLTPLQFEVLRLTDKLYLDSSYYTNDPLKRVGSILFNGMVDIRPKDSVLVNGSELAPHLRLRLDQAFGELFIHAGDLAFIDNNSFITYFKGVYVKTTDVNGTGQGCIASFNLLAELSKMTFYYRNLIPGTVISEQQVASFEINSDCPRINHYEHDYSLGTLGNIFPAPGDAHVYVQSMAGVKTRIKFPFIKNLSAIDPVSINKAELIIPVEDNATYKNHQNMILLGVDSAGKEALIPDILESTDYYGGSYVSADNAIKFNINRYVQRLVSGRIQNDYGLSLVAAGGAYNSLRTVVPGTTAPGSRIRLAITYSKLQ